MSNELTIRAGSKNLIELEKIIEKGLRTFTDVGSALLQIRDGKLYQPQYGSFEEYCRDRWDIERSHAYRLMDSAKVMANLKDSPIGELLPANESQARPLASLPPEQQAEAWNKAVKSAPKGKKPTAGLVQQIVDRIRSKTSREKRLLKANEGWTTEQLKDDTELFDAFKSIASVYGNDDTKAIRTGTVQLQRADVLFLGNLEKEKMLEIHDYVMASGWTPKQAVKFVNRTLEDSDPIEYLINRCLGKKGKPWIGHFHNGAFTITVKWNPPNERL